MKKPEAEVLCVGDFGLMQGVFQNLIINACHAMPEGGNIDISIEKKKSNIIISVRDNGTGIPEEVMPRIFEPFYTTKLTGKVRGTGLGLGIAKNSVLLHKGRINVDSTVGRGTKFTIVVPAYEEPIAVENIIAPGTPLKADAVISEGIQKHAHVLVVDDEEPVADLAKLIIEMKGHNVTVANSGEEAIAILRENKQIDIVITDLNMTPLTGFDVSMEARRISEAEGRNIYVVLSSGGGSMIDKEDAASKGVGFFLDKPSMKKD